MTFVAVLWILFILCWRASAADQYPSAASVNDILELANNHYNDVPFINNKEYLGNLSSYAGSSIIKKPLIIIGPKDSGKSEGLALMSKAWKNIGHKILDINFKGSLTVNGNKIMPYVSHELLKLLSSVKFYSYQDLFEIVFTDCAMNVEESSLMTLVKWITTHHKSILSIITSLAAILVILKTRFLFLCSLILLLIILLYFLWFNPIPFIEYMRPINYTITNGDWQTLICYLNKLTEIKPDNRPILLIREFNKMDDSTLLSCLETLEKAKERHILFPIILETSDSKWDNTSAVKKSRLSFDLYYMSEMTYSEGLAEVVNRLKQFVKDYDIVYESIGGHIGSYHTLLTNKKLHNVSIVKALEKMKKFAYGHLRSCIRQSKNISSTITALEMLTLNQTAVTLKSVDNQNHTSIYNYLIDCNVLFRNEDDKLVPQNRLMRNAIIRVLEEEKVYS